MRAAGGYAPERGGATDDPLPLAEIPALVFSELMRDVDLFVGVASVGNDPNWNDGGPRGRVRRLLEQLFLRRLGRERTNAKGHLGTAGSSPQNCGPVQFFPTSSLS